MSGNYSVLSVKFHPKFGIDGWLWVLLGAFQVFSSLRLHFGLKAPGISMLGVAMGCFLMAIPLLRSRCLCWECNPNALRERSFPGFNRDIPWNSITRVGEFDPGKDDGTLAVWYRNPKSKTGSSYLTARPVEREEFLETVEKFAPGVAIDVKRA